MAIAFGWHNEQSNSFLAANTTTNVGSTNAAGANGTFTVGDFLLTSLLWVSTPGAITPPSGWNQIGTTQTDINGVVYAWFYKIATGAETGSYTFSWVNSVFFTWALLDYTGSPVIDVSAVGNGTSGSTGVFTANSISPTGSSDILITIFNTDNTAVMTALTGNVRVNVNINSGASNIAEEDFNLGASGPTGNVTASYTTFKTFGWLMLAIQASGAAPALNAQIWM